MSVIEIKNLTKKYGTKTVLDKINFTVEKGDIMGLLGPNGAGKSTTMNILTGYLSLTEGSVSVCGFDILENPDEAKKHIGYLPEIPPLYIDMTVLEYLSFVYDLKKIKLDKKEHINSIMNMVKITHVQNRLIKNLSKGYKQRVGLAQALIGDPEILILDEPTVGLDPKQIIEIRNVIRSLGENRTIILSTHILQEVTAVCNKVTIINNGKIAAQDTLENLAGSIGGKGKHQIKVMATREAGAEVIKKIYGLLSFKFEDFDNEISTFIIDCGEKDLRPEVFTAFSKAGIPIVEFKSAEPTLEEVFIKITAHDKKVKEETNNESNVQ